jgi:phosphoribosylglycinamide formyltransferase 1
MGEVPRHPPIVAPPIRLAVCVSGEGTTLQNLIDQVKKRRLKAEIVQVVASRPRIGAIARAEAAHIPLALANYNSRSKTEFSNSVFEPIRHAKADLVILAGFLALLKIPADYNGRVLNVHPALIPAFCGKGYYGAKVHQAVLASGVKVSGCTVHLADNNYDNGPIIVQRAVPVLENDTVDTLAARVFKEECGALPEAITLFADGRLKLDGRCVHIAPKA